MKKFWKNSLLLLLICMLCAFSACGKDKEPDENTNNKEEVKKDEDIPVLYPSEPDKEDVKEEVPFDELENENTDPNSKEVVHAQTILTPGSTLTGLVALDEIKYYVTDPTNSRGLSTAKVSHSYGVAKNGEPHHITVDNQTLFDSWKHNALAWDNKSEEKVLYLTWDCGYEYENLTGKILDTLKEKNVPAAFFCTLDYLKDAPEFVVRMIQEGHVVGNHSTKHPSDSSALTRENLAWELLGVHNYLRTNFGYRSRYFRFPTGTYSENALDVVDDVGYRSVFWSIAHADWDPVNQPGVSKSFETVTSRLHPGAVILLHACSPDNAAILSDFIDHARNQGYVFKSLDEYAYWDN